VDTPLVRGELSMAFQRRKPAAIGIKAEYPGFIEPELATPVDKVPSGKRWIREVKFDGYRVQVHLNKGKVPETDMPSVTLI
jgi:ATP-dependent DNA ligase